MTRPARVEKKWATGNEEMVGGVTLVYNHPAGALSGKLTGHQYAHRDWLVMTATGQELPIIRCYLLCLT